MSNPSAHVSVSVCLALFLCSSLSLTVCVCMCLSVLSLAGLPWKYPEGAALAQTAFAGGGEGQFLVSHAQRP